MSGSASEKETSLDWETKSTHDGRLYYFNHVVKSCHWLPPSDKWQCIYSLPYGWEMARDENGEFYFINHLTERTSRKDPRIEDTINTGGLTNNTDPREVMLDRDEKLGFGFIAGSEKPVIIRSVIEGGPAEDKMFAGDRIISVNGEGVESAPNARVIELIKSCEDKVCLVVSSKQTELQLPKKSSFLNKAEKARKSSEHQLKVHFADPLSDTITSSNFGLPNEPVGKDVFRVYLENGQIRSMKFDHLTTVSEVIETLCEKLALRATHHFALMMEGPGQLQLIYIPCDHAVIDVNNLRSKVWKCRLRVRLVTKDVMELLKLDLNAFDYLFAQVCNDVVNGRFGSDLTNDVAIKLGALHMQQHAVRNGPTNKISIKTIEKECGLEKFLPEQVILSMKAKELRKMISHCVKLNQLMSLPGERHLTDVQAKLLYLKIAAELRVFGGSYYTAVLEKEEKKVMLLVSPRSGFCHVISRQRNLLTQFTDFSNLTELTITELEARHVRVCVGIRDQNHVVLAMDATTAVDMVNLLNGYHCLFTNQKSLLSQSATLGSENIADVPAYHNKHTVLASTWSYSSCGHSNGSLEQLDLNNSERVLDLRQSVFNYEKPAGSPFVVKLRATGINLVEESWNQSLQSRETDSYIQRRMMSPRQRGINDFSNEDAGEEVVAREAAQAAAARAVSRLKRASFTYSPPPSRQLVSGSQAGSQDTVKESEDGEIERSNEYFMLPEALTMSVFDDDTVCIDEEDDTLQTLLDSVNRTRSARGEKQLKIPLVADLWTGTDQMMAWDDSEDELRVKSNFDWNDTDSVDYDIALTTAEFDLPDEPLVPPPEFQEGFEELLEMNQYIPPPLEFSEVENDPELDNFVLPPPSDFDAHLISEELAYFSVPGEVVAMEPLELDSLPPLTSLCQEVPFVQPPDEFVACGHSSNSMQLDTVPHANFIKEAVVAACSSRESIVLTENIPDWLKRELEESKEEGTEQKGLMLDAAECDGDNDEFLIPATITAIDEYIVEDTGCLDQPEDVCLIPNCQLPSPSDLPYPLEVVVEEDLLEELAFDIPPPVVESEINTPATDDLLSVVQVEERHTSPPPLPTSPIPDEVLDVARNDLQGNRLVKEDDKDDSGPDIVPVSKKTAEVLKCLSMFGSSVTTSNRRVPPPTYPRPRSATTSLSREGKDLRDAPGKSLANGEIERLSTAGLASPRAGRLSKIVPRIASRFSPKLARKQSPKVVLKSYHRQSELVTSDENMVPSSSVTAVSSSSVIAAKPPSTKHYKAPQPPVGHRTNSEHLTKSLKPSSKSYRAPAPPTCGNSSMGIRVEANCSSTTPETLQKTVKSSSEYPIMHPHPWLPPSTGDSKHANISPNASPCRRRATYRSPVSPRKSPNQSPLGDTQSVNLSPRHETRELSPVHGTMIDSKQEQCIDESHVANEIYGNESNDDKSSLYIVSDSSPPPLPESLPPDEEDDNSAVAETDADDDNIFHRTMTDSCRKCILSLSDVVLKLDMSLQNVMSGSESELVNSCDLDYDAVKNSLVSEAKTLSQQTKVVVSAVVQKMATGNTEIEKALETVKRLATSCCQCVDYMTCSCTQFSVPDIRQTIIVGVMEVVGAFRHMVSAAAEAISKELEENSVLLLMDRAKAMAGIMASLMRTLNGLKEK